MIVVKLIGGLGNQMFQYAFGRSLSLYHKTELFFDIKGLLGKKMNETPRDFSLSKFDLKVNVNPPAFKIVSSWKKNIPAAVLNSFASVAVLKLVAEKKLHFDPTLENAGRNVYLDGYWQSPLYFRNYEEVIRSDFRFSSSVSEVARHVLSEIKTSNAVSLHIRRGDYVSNPEALAYHGACDLDYYSKAIEVIRNKIPNPIFFIFSDDPKWVEENFNLGAPSFIVSRPGLSQFDDLELMSSCKHAIIANSSFSWWGAWLINNPGKIVIAPKQWLRDGKIDTNNLFPKTWIRI